LRLPRVGKIWLISAGLLLVIGLFKSINLLALLSCLMLALWGLNYLLAGRQLRHLRGRRWINGPVFAGTPFSVMVEVNSSRRAATLGLGVEDDDGQLSWFTPLLQPHQTQAFFQDVVLPRRGAYTWGPLLAVSGYPFGLVRRRLELAPAEKVVVLPRLGRVHRGRLRSVLPPVGLADGRTPYAAHRHAGARAEFHGLRAFRSGDSPRWIHWRTTARCGELMVREFEDVPMNNLVVVVERNREQGTVDQATQALPRGVAAAFRFPAGEEAISLAATVCWEWCRQGGDHLVLAADSDRPLVLDGITGREHALRLLEALALFDTTAGPRSGPALPEVLAQQPLPPASILLVSAGGPGGLAEALRQQLRRPVAWVDASTLSGVDWYEKPTVAP
jgi:uncharacterized protein (DUF58 family)